MGILAARTARCAGAFSKIALSFRRKSEAVLVDASLLRTASLGVVSIPTDCALGSLVLYDGPFGVGFRVILRFRPDVNISRC